MLTDSELDRLNLATKLVEVVEDEDSYFDISDRNRVFESMMSEIESGNAVVEKGTDEFVEVTFDTESLLESINWSYQTAGEENKRALREVLESEKQFEFVILEEE